VYVRTWVPQTQVLFAGICNPCDALRMANFPYSRSHQRAPRVSLMKPASFSLSGKRISAVLHAVSTTGGLARMDRPLPPGTLGELAVATSLGQVCGLVEFLPLTKGNPTQAFRFIAFSDDDYERLSSTILAGCS